MTNITQLKIDVHHHVYPLIYTQALENAGGDPSGWFVPPWSIEADHDLCRKMGVSTAILSCTAPGPDIERDPSKAQALARAFNEYSASIRDAEPRAYGFFASVPSLLHIERAIEEMSHALDSLQADGIVLMSRYGDDNHYLGHSGFTPIWDFLNSRQAIVFIHPTHPVDTHLINQYLPQPAFDYPHETGRAAIDMIMTNMLRDHARSCKIILSHAGGTLPYLADRVAGLMSNAPSAFNSGKTRDEILAEAAMFYFDTALSSSPRVLTLLMDLLGPGRRDHLLFGTDFPNAPSPAIEYYTTQLESNVAFDVKDLRDNALKLFPRLSA